jgi:23S rRNA (guanosine2251-2'-O)-methyltransferase
MPGNSQRKGAIKKTGKGNPTAGSGGRVKRALEGKGPTPKAFERPNHKAYKERAKTAKSQTGRPVRRKTPGDSEWVAGRNSVVEALRADMPVIALYVAEGAERDGRLREAFQIAADRGISMLEVPRHEMDKMTAGAVHQGLALRVPAYEYAHPADLIDRAVEMHEAPLIVALDSITDPRNLGAVVRSAAGFGAHGVLVPERRAAGMTASAWKTSAGAAARVPVAQAVNLVRELKAYKEAGCTVVGLAADGDLSLPDLTGAELDLAKGALVVVVGSEGKGLSRLVSETCDRLVSIPMVNQIESLNAGVAASVTLYAIAQARGA